MQCRGKLARRWEMDLRKEIFWGDVLGDDKPVEPYFDVPYTAAPDDWGLAPVYHKTSASGSYVWDGAIKDYATDLKKLHSPTDRDRLGDHQRLLGDRPRRVGRSADGPAEGRLVVVAGTDVAGGHLSRSAKHALRFCRESRRAERTALHSSRADTSTSSTTWKPTIC